MFVSCLSLTLPLNEATSGQHQLKPEIPTSHLLTAQQQQQQLQLQQLQQ